MKSKKIGRIISGGQTGVDRAALDFALENKIAIGGFVPKHRLAEDGIIPLKYVNLRESKTENPAERTALNVRTSDATLILSCGKLGGGSLLTKKFAEKYEKPFLHVDFLVLSMMDAERKTRKWLASIECEALNVAGPRASEDALIYELTGEFLKKIFIVSD
ncbi:MAG TPA: putative molybdenum carrier protein [Pyrinomonadaceae bacterium]|jgi:hypothetical protein